MAGPELPVLQGERVVLRPVRDDDLAPLLAMLAAPEVARWLGRWDAARVQRDLLDPKDDEVVLAIEVGFRPVGVMRQYEQAPDGTWRDGLLMDLLAEEYRAL
jgi:RimJ/RimL family protein N-acetyltransferase